MTYGLRTWNENGVLAMDTNTFTYQILGQWVLDFSNSTTSNPITTTLSIPGFSPTTCALILLPTRAQDIYYPGSADNAKCYPYVEVSAGQAIIYSKLPNSQSYTAPCRAILRAMAIRYA